jgi:ubiquitin carboxyl-terminal hydrolase 10
MFVINILAQPDSVHTVEDALAHIPQSQPQPLQVGQLRSSEASEQVQIEKLPSVLVLHLKRFMYDAAVDGTFKISKSVQFAPELEIPLGMVFSVVSPRASQG